METQYAARQLRVESECLAGRLDEVPKCLEDVFARMKKDRVTELAKKDFLIKELGVKWFKKTVGMRNKAAKRKHLISQEMRVSARLLDNLQLLKPDIDNMWDFLKPSLFDTVVTGVQMTAGHDAEQEKFDVASVALKLGHRLNKMAAFKKSFAGKKSDEKGQKEAKEFMELMTEEWAESVSLAALNTLSEKKYNRAVELPQAIELKALSDYLKVSLETITDTTSFRMVQKLLMTRLLTYNKRRPGEIEAMMLV